jgi:hypothetical protein
MPQDLNIAEAGDTRKVGKIVRSHAIASGLELAAGSD